MIVVVELGTVTTADAVVLAKGLCRTMWSIVCMLGGRNSGG